MLKEWIAKGDKKMSREKITIYKKIFEWKVQRKNIFKLKRVQPLLKSHQRTFLLKEFLEGDTTPKRIIF